MGVNWYSYNKASIFFFVMSALVFFLVLRELPNNDSAQGDYITLAMHLAKADPEITPQIRATPSGIITEERIISALFIVSVSLSAVAIIFGLVAKKRKEHSLGYSASITAGILLLATAYKYGWILNGL